MKNILIVLVVAGIACGCSAKIGNSKLGTSKSKIERQMSGVKNKADIRKELGTPNLVFDKGSAEAYEYKVISGAGRYHWLIPVWGWIAPIWQDTYTFRETNLFVAFGKDDKVKNWNVIQTGGTTD
jgi:hypothetical protein